MKPSDLPSTERVGTIGLQTRWRIALSATVVASAVLLAVYWSSFVALVNSWGRSETYQHAFVVIPVSLWLIWRERDRLARTAPSAFLPGLALLGVLSVLWLLGDLTSTQAFKDLAVVASVPVLLVTMLGLSFASACALPLAIMLFAWPFGDFLIAPLIDWTANFTAAALRLTGVPVLREGSNLTVPTGHWSVVSACSGIRYLMAALFAGSVFAYLSYRSWWRQGAFMALVIVGSIVANWIRAYLIVLIGHLSDNRLGVGADHVIGGWMFFGLLMIVLFYIGARWKEPHFDQSASLSRDTAGSNPHRAGRFALATAGVALVTAVGPAVAFAVSRDSIAAGQAVHVVAPPGNTTWVQVPASVEGWQSPFERPTALVVQGYSSGRQHVILAIAYYRHQREGAKLLTLSSTQLPDYGSRWRILGSYLENLPAPGGPDRVIARPLSSPGQNVLTWQWYWIYGLHTPSVWRVKLAEVNARLRMHGDDAAGVVLLTPYSDSPAEASAVLAGFMQVMGPEVTRVLNDAAGE